MKTNLTNCVRWIWNISVNKSICLIRISSVWKKNLTFRLTSTKVLSIKNHFGLLIFVPEIKVGDFFIYCNFYIVAEHFHEQNFRLKFINRGRDLIFVFNKNFVETKFPSIVSTFSVPHSRGNIQNKRNFYRKFQWWNVFFVDISIRFYFFSSVPSSVYARYWVDGHFSISLLNFFSWFRLQFLFLLNVGR